MYNEEEKVISRRTSLKYAVDILTSERCQAPILGKEYLRSTITEIQKRRISEGVRSEHVCADSDIELWENLWHSSNGNKDPSQLKVAYLSGPNPSNDLDVLVECGITPYNIWAFESDKRNYCAARENLSQSQYPFLKLHPCTIDSFLESTPQKFDLIYIDACGPLPSSEQRTLKTLANIFRYYRLESPGVLVTNFADPDRSNQKTFQSYIDLISAYLISHDEIDRHIDVDFSEKENEAGELMSRQEMFSGLVFNNFEKFYSYFITKIIIDISSCYSPITSLSNTSMWNFFALKDPKEIFNIAKNELKDSVFDPVESIPNSIFNVDNLKSTISKKFINEMSGNDSGRKFTALQSVIAFFYLKNIKNIIQLKRWSDLDKYYNFGISNDGIPCVESDLEGEFISKDFAEILSVLQTHPYYCEFLSDEAISGDIFFPIISQYSYPYHINIKKTKRYSYIASGKTHRMFVDVIPFDNCRYIYDWLPSLQIVKSSFLNDSQQLIFKYLIDGLTQHIYNYCKDILPENEYLILDLNKKFLLNKRVYI